MRGRKIIEVPQQLRSERIKQVPGRGRGLVGLGQWFFKCAGLPASLRAG